MKNDLILYLAPMAGYTDLPFRLLAQENGANILTSEMISAKGLYYKDKKTALLYKTNPLENHFGIQLFGSEPQILKAAVLDLEEKKKTGVASYGFLDFNVGCPAPKIVKNGDGSALLNNLNLLSSCIGAIKNNTDVPVSVKTRIGFNDNNGLEIAKVIEDSGADRLIIHPRTRDQFYSGHSDWKTASKILEQSKIPVVLSGDITTPEKAQEAYNLGFNQLMIGRAAVENPTIFKQTRDFIETGSYIPLTGKDKITLALRHIELGEKYNDHDRLIVALRKQLAAYIKGIPNASHLRDKIFKITDKFEIKNLFEEIKKEL